MNEFFSFLIAGIVTGSIYAVSASGLVVTYNTTGIFNFAHGAVGMVLAFLFWQLWQSWGLNPVLSLVIVLLVAAPLGGAVVERLIMRPLYGASINVSLVVSLGLLLLLFGINNSIWNPSSTSYVLPEFFTGDQFSIGGVNISYEQWITIAIAVAAAVFFWAFFKRTRTGIAMRAVVDDPDLARLAGAPSGRISSYAWMIGTMLAGVAGILLAQTTGQMQATVLTELVIYGFAAAVVGRLRSLPLTFLGAMILGIANSMVIGYMPQSAVTDVTAALPMALLLVVLLIMPEARLAIGRVARMRAPRAASRNMTLVGGVALVGITIVLAYALTGSNLNTLADALGLSLLALSLVPLSGYGGQVSLCQFTFAGLGAWTMHSVDGGSSMLGLLAAVGLCAAGGAVLAIPAIRLRNIYLALATLAFAVLMDNIFFVSTSLFPNGLVSVGRPDIFGMRFVTTRSFAILLAIVLALALVAVGAVRRGSVGRRLVALQDSPVASTTVGASLTITKLGVFTGSAALAGLAGALWAGIGGSIGAQSVVFFQSVLLFVALTLAGSRMLTSALWAGALLAVVPVIASHIPSLADFEYILLGVGIIAIGRNPNALGLVYAQAGDWWRARRGARQPVGGATAEAPSTEAVAGAHEVPSLG